MDLGRVNIRACNLFVSGPKFTEFFCFNAGGMAVDQVCYRFSVCRFAPNIFAVRVCCPKSRQILNLGRSTSASITFLFVNRSSPIFFFNTAGIAFDEVCVPLSISWPFFEIFAVKVESCPKSRRILEVFCLYISDNGPLMACHVAKFHGVTRPNFRVIGANTLNYEPIFDPPLKKIVGEPRPRWGIH